MSRSYRKTPIVGNVVLRRETEKKDKRLANRRLRRAIHAVLLASANDHDGNCLPLMRELSQVYTFAKDGKHYMRVRRCDPAEYARCMRK